MKTERRHELQKNQLADVLGSTVERVRPFTNILIGAVVAIAVVAVAAWYLNRQSEAAQAQGWDQLYQAGTPEELESLAIQFADTPAGTWARIRLADRQLAQGIEALFNDRAEANSELRNAKDNYNLVLSNRGASELALQRASQGLARSSESLNELPQAREMYQSIVNRWPESAYAQEARRRLTDLDLRSTQSFYDWFSQQNPTPPADDEPSVFGTEGNNPLGISDEPGAAFDAIMSDTPATSETPAAAAPDDVPAQPAAEDEVAEESAEAEEGSAEDETTAPDEAEAEAPETPAEP